MAITKKGGFMTKELTFDEQSNLLIFSALLGNKFKQKLDDLRQEIMLEFETLLTAFLLTYHNPHDV